MADILTYVALGLIAAQAVALGVLARAFVRHSRKGATIPQAPIATASTAPAPTPAVASSGELEDVFVLHRSGLLLKHYTRRLRPNMDSDVLSGMLAAVQGFIKDAFRAESGTLDEIQFWDMRIRVLEGKWTILAALIRGEATEDHRAELRAALKDLETRYEDLLIDWDGTMDRIPEVDRIMQRLLEGGYAVHRP